MTLVVNFLGGPGSGKSIMAANIFSTLKWKGYNCEIASEYAKEKVWENSLDVLQDQIYLLGKQHHRIKILENKVDVILCDSPIILNIFYGKNNLPNDIYEPFEKLILSLYNSMNNFNIFLNRHSTYEFEGRLQNLEDAIKIDNKIINIMNKFNLPHIKINSNEKSVNEIVNIIKNKQQL